MGKSRSTTCIIAYLLHRDRTLTPSAALSRLREVRPICEPNDGFTQQLELYHQMRCPDNVDVEPAYQRWRYKREVETSVACGMAPDNIRFQDEREEVRVEEDEGPAPDLELRCRKCRRKLAASQHLIPHTPKASSLSSASVSSTPSGQPPSRPQSQPPCAHLYIDPLSWMRPELEQGKLDGRLECPKCGTNVGKYAWQGMRCSCGDWVVPAVCLARGRVDEVKSRPGTEMAVGRAGGNL